LVKFAERPGGHSGAMLRQSRIGDVSRDEVQQMLEGERRALELRIRAEVQKQFDNSLGALQRTLDEARHLQNSLRGAVDRCAQEVLGAEGLYHKLRALRVELTHEAKDRASAGSISSQKQQPQQFEQLQQQYQQQPEQQTILYRNIRHVDDGEGSLPVFHDSDCKRPCSVVFGFGELLEVQKELRIESGMLMLQLASDACICGEAFGGCWVQAVLPDGTIQVAKLTGNESSGRPSPDETRGLDLDHLHSCSYGGESGVVVLSASGHSFWTALHRTCLLRGISSVACHRKQAGHLEDAPDRWLPLYAASIYRYALSAKKEMLVTVEPTANWRRYAGPTGTSVPDVKDVLSDIGPSQHAECQWLAQSELNGLGFSWQDVHFMTTLGLLRQHGNWTSLDCMREASEQVAAARDSFRELSTESMEAEFFRQVFCIEEAFGLEDLQADLGVPVADRRRATHEPHPRLYSAAAVDERPPMLQVSKELLAEMHKMWKASKRHADRTMKKLRLSGADLHDDAVLSGPVLNRVVGTSVPPEIAERVLDQLKQRGMLHSALLRKDQAGLTPLHCAVACGNEPATGLLIDAAIAAGKLGEVLAARGYDVGTPLHSAAAGVGWHAARLIIDAASCTGQVQDLLVERDKDGFTPFNRAIAAGNAKTLRLLISAAKSTGQVCEIFAEKGNSSGRRPLHCAATSRNPDSLQLLLEVAATSGRLRELLVQKDQKGRTPLHCVAAVSEDAVRVILDAARSSASAASGAWCDDDQWAMHFLLAVDEHGYTALHYAVRSDRVGTARLLLVAAASAAKDGASQMLTAKDRYGYVPPSFSRGEAMGQLLKTVRSEPF